jgi:hypothetical protein
MMKTFIRAFSAIIIFTLLVSFLPADKKPNSNSENPSLAVISSKQMDANYIRTWFRNNGSFNRNPSTGNSGFEWPKGSGKFARYASGLWIGAVVDDDTLVAIAEYDYEYLPGFINNNGEPQGKDDSLFRIYKINKNDVSSYDYLHWPFNQGAYADSNGKPLLIGDQTMFYSYTDGYPEAHGNNAGSTAPLKAQILQTNWCFVRNAGTMNDIIYTEYRMINRGNLPWTKCYFGNWTDDDLGSATDDAVGCDTNLNLGFTYIFDNSDPDYGLSPPAVGFQIVRGPLVQSPGDTARYYYPPGSNNLLVRPGFRLSGMSSFNMYTGGNPSVGDPSNYRETYLNLQGIRRNGTPWINPVNGQVTKFAFSGDPESGEGWNEQSSDDRRSIQSFGPYTINPGDTQSIVVAQLIARGSNNLNSVTLLKAIARITREFFNQNFNVKLTAPKPAVSSYAPGNSKIYLAWNDTCERVSFPNKLTGGTYKFQGYNIYRIRPNTIYPNKSDTILIKTFDIIDGIRNIRDSVYDEEYQNIVYGVVQNGSDNGIVRSIELTKDTVSGTGFVNGTEYKFAITAYYYDPSGGINSLPKLLTSSLTENIIRIIPQGIAPEAYVNYQQSDTIRTDQRDLAVMPIVIDPLGLVSARYVSVFGGTFASPNWTLTKTQSGNTTIIFENVFNFTGNQDTAKVTDGMMLIHQIIRDSGVIADPRTPNYYGHANRDGWQYEPPENLWFEGPDTTAVKTAKVITNRQFQSRSIGMSFPTTATFRNSVTKVKANKTSFVPVSGQNSILTGGPLRKIQIVFGQVSKSYRYVPSDTNLTSAPYGSFVDVPFSVYAVDELDSSGGTPRQLNTGFLDADNNALWDPDTSALGNYHFVFIFASDYNPSPQQDYMTKNVMISNPAIGFPSLDVMYAWLARAKKNADGTPKTYTAGDRLTVWPYRITRPEFVPGYPVKYSWEVQGTTVSSSAITSAEIASINVFPNPYYGTSELEYDSGGEKFIYFSNLPLQSKIYIYTLDGILVKRIDRDNIDPNSSLQKWNLKNSDGSFVASGMYIVFVDCGSAGAKTLKVAVFKSN